MPALYWASTNVSTQGGGPTLGDWRNVARDAMVKIGFQGVSENPDDVNGGTQDTFAAVTFIQLSGDGSTYAAVIMVAGDNANTAMEARASILNYIKNAAWL